MVAVKWLGGGLKMAVIFGCENCETANNMGFCQRYTFIVEIHGKQYTSNVYIGTKVYFKRTRRVNTNDKERRMVVEKRGH